MLKEGGDWELLFNGSRVSVLQDRVRKIDGSNTWETLWMYLITLNCTLKDDYDEILCYAYFVTIKKLEKNFSKNTHTHTPV